MTIPDPDRRGIPNGRDDGDLWQKLLTDNEQAIRASAPREPSARERAAAQPSFKPDSGPQGYRVEAVGDLWEPPAPQPSWWELDRPARIRRAGRMLATVAVLGLALGAWSWLSTMAGAPGGDPGTTIQQVEEAPDAVPATSPAPTSTPAVPTPTVSIG
ncbi:MULTISPECIES: hypothetical protein [Streptomyces]|uniref:hypothetical protein n=1 Tax=Streptomyces TaxID=1883 RepID=UPI0031D235F1